MGRRIGPAKIKQYSLIGEADCPARYGRSFSSVADRTRHAQRSNLAIDADILSAGLPPSPRGARTIASRLFHSG
jgi:hypothetical protein